MAEAETIYELIDGEIVATPIGGPSGQHSKIIVQVATKLELFAGESAGDKKLGDVYSTSACTLGRPKGENYPVPDVCLVANGRTPARFTGLSQLLPI